MSEKLTLILFIAFIYNGCSQKVVPVKHVKSAKIPVSSETILPAVYCLPLTGVEAEFIISKNNRYAGPYAQYAKKLLGIEKGVITNDEVSYKFERISLKQIEKADHKACFTLVAINTDVMPVSLYDNGTLAGINLDFKLDLPQAAIKTVYFTDSIDGVIFPDVSPKRFVGSKSEAPKKVKTDTAIIQVPSVREHELIKVADLKAEEAANFIFKIRKRRVKMLGSFSEQPVPDVGAPELSQKLDSIEKSYVELFTGKSIVETEKLSFSIFPEKPDTNILLFYFSPQTGAVIPEKITSSMNTDFPVAVSFKSHYKHNQTHVADTILGLAIRNPLPADVFVTINDQLLMHDEMDFNQFGNYMFIDDKYLIDNRFIITFYRLSGRLKEILKK